MFLPQRTSSNLHKITNSRFQVLIDYDWQQSYYLRSCYLQSWSAISSPWFSNSEFWSLKGKIQKTTSACKNTSCTKEDLISLPICALICVSYVLLLEFLRSMKGYIKKGRECYQCAAAFARLPTGISFKFGSSLKTSIDPDTKYRSLTLSSISMIPPPDSFSSPGY